MIAVRIKPNAGTGTTVEKHVGCSWKVEDGGCLILRHRTANKDFPHEFYRYAPGTWISVWFESE